MGKVLGIHFEITNVLKGKTSKAEVEIFKSNKDATEKAEKLSQEIKSLDADIIRLEKQLEEERKNLLELQEYYSGQFIIHKDNISKLRDESKELQMNIQTKQNAAKNKM